VIVVAALTFACIFVYCCGFMIAPWIYQEIRLASFNSAFQDIPHPAGTTLVERKTGLIHTTTNDCAYFVGELRRSEGTRQEVVDYYRGQRRKDPFGEDWYLVFVGDTGLESREICLDGESDSSRECWPAVGPDLLENTEDWTIPHPLTGNFYIVFFAYEGSFYLDRRCH
jgi:hypothetical protein